MFLRKVNIPNTAYMVSWDIIRCVRWLCFGSHVM